MSLPSHLSSLLFLLSATVPLASAGPSLTDDSKCGCYLTNGTENEFFSTHKFFDFRDLSQYQGVPEPVTDPNAASTATETSSYFTSDSWSNTWDIQTWNNSQRVRKDATVSMVNSKNNIYIEQNQGQSTTAKTWLTLRTQRLPGFQTAAEFASNERIYQFLSVRMLARTTGASGACTAMFTYRDSNDIALVQEADLEVLTNDPRDNIRYTNQPSYTSGGDEVEAATENGTMPNGLEWSAWAVHRLDWTPNQSTWYVDGEQVANISFQAPRDASNLIFNAWSDGGNWTGNMSMYDAAYLQIQWIDLVFNATDKNKREEAPTGLVSRFGQVLGRDSSKATCKSVCSIDATPSTGQPVLLWSNGAARLLDRSGLIAWVPSLVVATMFISSCGLFQ